MDNTQYCLDDVAHYTARKSSIPSVAKMTAKEQVRWAEMREAINGQVTPRWSKALLFAFHYSPADTRIIIKAAMLKELVIELVDDKYAWRC